MTILVHLPLLFRRILHTSGQVLCTLLRLEVDEQVPEHCVKRPVILVAGVIELKFDVDLLLVFCGRV